MSIRKQLDTVKWWWTADGYIYGERGVATSQGWRRERELSEYPEMQHRYWAGTIDAIDVAIKDLYDARAFALAEYEKTQAPADA